MSEVAQNAMPDFSKPDEVLADIERMRKEAMKKKVFILVGKCGTAASKIKDAVEKDPQGTNPRSSDSGSASTKSSKKIPDRVCH
ncbi:MAG: hypothetical protein M5R36_27005 [Deltaproteobacteria bacterium]|nr:hypothetical protein [Deltaproteobacteria bacterium]